jgi:imidazoleglycerol-phosphate dehydratase
MADMAKVNVKRSTKETEINVTLNPYGSGKAKIATGVGFFDHMLELLAFHAAFDLEVTAKGDLHIDVHHTVEDTGIVLGQVFRKSLPGKQAFVRYADAFVPMDETLARAVVDISGRPFLVFDAQFDNPKLGDFDTELVQEFFQAFAANAGITLHLKVEYGRNSHHKIEALFKATAVALRRALQQDDSRKGPASTKGVLV